MANAFEVSKSNKFSRKKHRFDNRNTFVIVTVNTISKSINIYLCNKLLVWDNNVFWQECVREKKKRELGYQTDSVDEAFVTLYG